ncbi:MAG: 6-phosphogluconolactonase, partial [Pseudomonas sp.]|nr:6-phosphogluconolactonase [Pseudomonas sp.]
PAARHRCWSPSVTRLTTASSVPHQRLSMTRALLAGAGFIALSVQGAGKLTTLRAALAAEDPTEMPIRAFLHDPLDIYWCP